MSIIVIVFPQYSYIGDLFITIPRNNDVILPVPWDIVISGFHCKWVRWGNYQSSHPRPQVPTLITRPMSPSCTSSYVLQHRTIMPTCMLSRTYLAYSSLLERSLRRLNSVGMAMASPSLELLSVSLLDTASLSSSSSSSTSDESSLEVSSGGTTCRSWPSGTCQRQYRYFTWIVLRFCRNCAKSLHSRFTHTGNIPAKQRGLTAPCTLCHYLFTCGLVVNALDFPSGGWWFVHGLCHRIVSLDKTLYSTLFLFTQVYKWVPLMIMLGGNLVMD